MTINKYIRSLIASIALIIGMPSTSWAIVINNASGAATAIALGTPQTSVVELFLGGGLCSGALISNMHVVTAQHCTFGVGAGAMTVNFHTNNDGIPDAVRAVSAKAEIDVTNVLLDGTDVAILTLATNMDSIMPLSFLSSDPTGEMASTYGFGLNGLGSVGHGGTRDGLRWGATNTLHSYGPALGCGGGAIGGTANILNTDFDDGSPGANCLGGAMPLVDEGTTAPGDSGGPLMINGLIAGVLSGGTSPTSQYGDISWWTGTFSPTVRDFITMSTNGKANFVTGVPEPSVLLLLLGGLVALRRRLI